MIKFVLPLTLVTLLLACAETPVTQAGGNDVNPIIGTWKTTSAVLSPAYTAVTKDIIGILRSGSFDLYYYTAGTSTLEKYSGKGTAPSSYTEGIWLTITETSFYDPLATPQWDTWVLTSGVMKIKYTFTSGDKKTMSLQVDSDSNGTADYTWNLTQQTSATTTLHS